VHAGITMQQLHR